jgi:hypothetical protein
MFVTADQIRDSLGLTGTYSAGPYSDTTIGSNIRAATAYLERKTGRQFTKQESYAKTFTSHNRAAFTIPDLQSASSVTENGAALVADESYYLIPDRTSSGVYTAIAFRVASQRRDGPEYLHNPEWWDRGLDWRHYGPYESEHNDIVVTGDWGYDEVSGLLLPEDAKHAIKILSSFYTKRPDSVLSNVAVTPEGAVLTYRELPMEVRQFIEEWTLGEQVTAV